MIVESVSIYYKDGQEFPFEYLIGTTTWHRGIHVTRKSRKLFTCACGCDIPIGSTYLTLEMMAGGGCGTFLVDFALCRIHLNATEVLLGKPISSDIHTRQIIKIWVQIQQSEINLARQSSSAQTEIQHEEANNLVALRSYSWEILSEICAVKSVDKTLRAEGSTGIPRNVVPFFTGHQLMEGQEQTIEFSVLDTIAYCTISRKQDRHRLFLKPLKQKLIQLGVKIGDLLFFERDVVVLNRFNVSVLNQKNEVVIQTRSSPAPPGGERNAYAILRKGQDIFRKRVQRAYGYRCCLSGIEDTAPSILIASHIKPWRLATPIEKTDVFNGLLLAPHYDKLFDQGLISFSDDGKLLFSNKLAEHIVQAWGLKNKALRIVHPQSVPYLNFHRNYFGF